MRGDFAWWDPHPKRHAHDVYDQALPGGGEPTIRCAGFLVPRPPEGGD